MSRLIAVSIRVPAEAEEGHAERAGPVMAYAAALRGENGFWFGWSGGETDSFTGQITFRRSDGVATATIDLDHEDIAEYRSGFANSTFWPLAHARPDLVDLAADAGGGYARINFRFAGTLAPLIEPEDVIWVHGYHLIPLGEHLRIQGFANRIGFFLHIPWPPASLLKWLPGHRELIESMLAYDVIGFQTENSRDAFRDSVTEALDADVDADCVVLGERRSRLLACPMGLDASDFGGAVHSLQAKQAETRLVVSAGGRDMILGVDRLDHSKGLRERFAGFERLLAALPELHDKVFMLQIAPPSRGDVPGHDAIRAELSALTGSINASFAAIDWVPIRFVNQAFSRDELFGIYRAARVGLVTPLVSGMSLVAKEYIAAQDPADPGVLVLSRGAGTAAQLAEAVIVDPGDPEDMAQGIARALAMPIAERQERHKAMLDRITAQDVRWWSQTFLAALRPEEPLEAGQPAEHLQAAAGGG